ncbi:hypothetical protein CJU94_35800 (plasmid) [Paraburkholderia aromaticivorans]|uniref:Uncharacterized protein n=1 Tax=Paraburkholderia aromaticivorans TaxID=2026199 RepID=A0A248VYQ2_9BURK|nr:hypothetical protein CJU94_35800 [Paraburkholderia aromaticivorans]
MRWFLLGCVGFQGFDAAVGHDPFAMDLPRTATVVHAHKTTQPRDLFQLFSNVVDETVLRGVISACQPEQPGRREYSGK